MDQGRTERSTATVIIALTVLAVARLTRLVIYDRITERPRVWLTVRLEKRPQLQYLVNCPWCLSMYVGAASACAYALWGETMPFMVVTLALASSYVTGFLASIREAGD